jgi:hypothetical protein
MRMKKIVDEPYLNPVEGAVLGFLIFTLLLVLLWILRIFGLAVPLLVPGIVISAIDLLQKSVGTEFKVVDRSDQVET